MSVKKLVSRDAKHYLVKRPNKILTNKLSWNQVQAELEKLGTDADEAMLFRGIVIDDGTEYRDMYADSRTQITEHTAKASDEGTEQ
ncbi:MAG TPA: hypothetical protein VGB17_11900 [Pyrinomonadaceae bacterium]|jgi:hypothetical protein